MAGFSFYSVGSYTTGLFMEPLAKEFGWGRAQISAGLLVTSIMTIPMSPVVGALIDRWGSRRLAIPGMALAIAAVACFSLANGDAKQWLLLWTFYGLASLMIKATVWTAATSNVFTSGRGLALGLVLCGSALTQTIAPVLAERLIDAFGWRQAYVWISLAWGGPVLLVILLFMFEPADRATKKGAAPSPSRAAAAAGVGGLGFGEAFRNVPLVRIGVSTLLFMFLTVAILIHQVPILTEAGVSRRHAALLASLGGVAGIVGKLVTGWASDRYDGSTVGAVTLGSTAIAFTLLLEPFRSPATIVIAMIIIGYGSGTKLQVTAYLTGRYGGLRNFGKIFGVMSSLIAVGGGLGPIAAGAVYDNFGTYNPLLLVGIPGALLCGLLIFRLGPYPDWAITPAADEISFSSAADAQEGALEHLGNEHPRFR